MCGQTGLSSLVLRKKRPLIAAFTQVDKTGTGYISKERWCQVMDSVSYRTPRPATGVVVCVCVCAGVCFFSLWCGENHVELWSNRSTALDFCAVVCFLCLACLLVSSTWSLLLPAVAVDCVVTPIYTWVYILWVNNHAIVCVCVDIRSWDSCRRRHPCVRFCCCFVQ